MYLKQSIRSTPHFPYIPCRPGFVCHYWPLQKLRSTGICWLCSQLLVRPSQHPTHGKANSTSWSLLTSTDTMTDIQQPLYINSAWNRRESCLLGYGSRVCYQMSVQSGQCIVRSSHEFKGLPLPHSFSNIVNNLPMRFWSILALSLLIMTGEGEGLGF